MTPRVALTIFRIGDPPRAGEGLRIGVVRRPPRGVRKDRWQVDGYFDVWLPVVAPSAALLARLRAGWDLDTPADRARFFRAYERELARPDARQVIDLLSALARRTPIAVGCYCEDASRCHRTVLARVIRGRAANRKP
jgi:uncharacterized protein YeaO (DUF488 family)